MAIDPNISLGVRIPQIAIPTFPIQSPLEKFQKIQSLRNLMAQGQVYQQNLEQTQLENEALREKARRTTALANLFSGGKRPTDDQIRAVGGPEAATQIKSLYDADKSQFESMAEGHKQLVGVAQGIASLPEKQRDFAYRVTRSRLHPAIQAQMPEEYPGHDWIGQQIQTGFTTQDYFNNIRANAEEQRKEALAPAQKSKAQAEADEAEAKSKAAQLKHAVMVMPNTKDAWEKVWYPALPAALKADISPTYSSEEADRVRAMLVLPTAAEPGKDIPYAPGVFAQKKTLAEAGAPRLPSPGMTPEAEAQTIRISKATQGAKPPSGAQSKALAFYIRAKDAEDTLTSLQPKMVDKNLLSQGVFKYAPNFLQSSENQVYQQAQRAFTEARLRKESGAAVPPHEYAADAITYFPQPGDDPENLERKRIGREKVLEGIRQESGRAYAEYYGEEPPKAKNAPGAGGLPKINTKEEWDKLPSGAQYVDAQDGKTYTKR